jgi:hypothetical protein
MAAVLSSLEMKTGLRAARAHRVVRWVAFLQIKAAGSGAFTPWPAVPIAASKGARLTGWSESSWRRGVVEAEKLGWIERIVRSGRVRGNRHGYNPGSLYRVVWQMLPGGRPAADGGAPLVVYQAARVQRVKTRSADSGNLHGELHNSYSPNGKEPSHGAKEPSQTGGAPNSEPSQTDLQPSQVFDLRTQSNLDPVRPIGRDVSAARPVTPAAALPDRADGGTVTTPKPPPQGGGQRSADEGVPCPPDVAAEAKSAPWYRGRSR